MTEFDAVYQRYFRDVYKYALVLCRDHTTYQTLSNGYLAAQNTDLLWQ